MNTINIKRLLSAGFTLTALISVNVMADTWELAWKTTGLLNPESVVFDEKRNVLFVSNQNGAGEAGEASIGQLTLNGAIIEAEWVKGLNEPKGLLIDGDNLYVSDITSLVEIDINKGEIVNRYEGAGAKFLNDVEQDDAGNIYVSDMFNSSIYRLTPEKEFSLWMESPELENPNGLLIEGDALYISAWGAFNDGNPMKAPAGHFLKVSLSTQEIETLSEEAVGNLDGLHRLDESTFLLSDWIAGGVYQFSNGQATNIIDTEQSSGDIEYLADQDMILIPMAATSEVLAYTRTDIERPLGVRRDGSYYSRLEWTNATLDTPLYWAANINDDDTARNSGSWGAPTTGPAEVVLSFFGELQPINRIKLFHNVGATVSPLDELAKAIKIYVSNDSGLQRIGDKDAVLDDFNWQEIVSSDLEQREGWFEFTLDAPVNARYVRVQLVENYGTPPERSFTETNEIKFYPK